MKELLKKYSLVIVFLIGWLAAVIYFGEVNIHIVDSSPNEPTSFHFQDFIIVPEVVKGFHIQEWPIASYDDPGSIFEVQLLIDGGYTRGPTFDAHDKATRTMLYLKERCGL